MGEKIENKKHPKNHITDFYPSQEIIARAIAAGHNNATDADIIQEFIDKNTAWGSTFADFNPIYLSFLAKHAERQQQESIISNLKTRSKDNERASPKTNSYDAALEEVRKNNQNACQPFRQMSYSQSQNPSVPSLSAHHVSWLWVELTKIYGTLFLTKFGPKDNGTWFEALKGLTPKALESGNGQNKKFIRKWEIHRIPTQLPAV